MSAPELPPGYRYVNHEVPDEGVEFACLHCAAHHPLTEIGFRLPDSVFRLEGGHQNEAHVGTEDIVRIGVDAFFIRGVAKFDVPGLDIGWGIGFWLQVSSPEWTAFLEAKGRLEKPIQGTIANQADYWGPTLGASAQAVDAGPEMRPTLDLMSASEGTLADLQRSGIPPESLRQKLSGEYHVGAAAPARPLGFAEVERDGWQVLHRDEFADAGTPVTEKIAPGDFVKVPVAFSAAAQTGEPETLVALWWVEVKNVDEHGEWSGTLANDPPFPATLAFGSWICGGRLNIIRSAGAEEARGAADG